MSILFRNASLRERSDNTAGSCSCGCANRRRGQPTGCDNRPEAGDRQQAEPGKKAGSATYARTNAGAFPSTLGAIVDAIRDKLATARSAPNAKSARWRGAA